MAIRRIVASCPMWHNGTVPRLNSQAISWIIGARVKQLKGWSRAVESASPVIPATSKHLPRTTKQVPPATDHALGTTELEVLLAGLTPYRIGKMAAERAARRLEREQARARVAAELLAAGRLAHPGKRFSMADAALARVARVLDAGANEGSDRGADAGESANGVPGANGSERQRVSGEPMLAELPPKKSALRGEARKLAWGDKAQREPLAKGNGVQYRGNGRPKRSLARGVHKQGV